MQANVKGGVLDKILSAEPGEMVYLSAPEIHIVMDAVSHSKANGAFEVFRDLLNPSMTSTILGRTIKLCR